MPAGRPPKGADYKARIRVNWRIEPDVFKAMEKFVNRQNRHLPAGRKLTRNTVVDRALRSYMEAEGMLSPSAGTEEAEAR